MSPKPSDESLLERFAAEDEPAALEALIKRHHAAAFRRAHNMLGDPAAAEDAVQNALIAVARKAGQFRSGEAFAPWFYRILQNKVRDELRRADARRRHESRAPAAASEGEVSEDKRALRLHLERLPYELRAALTLHFLDGLSHRRLAAELGWSAGTVSGRIRRGLERLRRSLTSAGYSALAPSLGQALRGLVAAPIAPRPPAAALIMAGAARPALAASLASKAAVILAISLAATLAVVFWPLRSEGRRAAAEPPPRASSSARPPGLENGEGPAERAGGKPPPPKIQTKPAALDLSGEDEAERTSAPEQETDGVAAPNEPGPITPTSPTLAIAVLDREGRPAAGARVWVTTFARRPLRWSPKAAHDTWLVGGRADERGRYDLKVPLQGRRGMSFVVEASLGGDHGVGDALKLAPGVRREAAVQLRPFEQPLAGFGALIIEVSDERGPLPAGTIVEGSAGRRRFRLPVDQAGRLLLGDLPAGDHALTLNGDGYQQMILPIGPIVIRAGEIARHRHRLARERVLEGAIRIPAGLDPEDIEFIAPRQVGGYSEPIPAMVEIRSGRYRCRGLPPGKYLFKVRGRGFWPRRFEVELSAPGLTAGPELDLTAGAAIRGRVRDAEGRPHPQAPIELWSKPGSLPGGRARASADDSGAFVIHGVPDGEYLLQASEFRITSSLLRPDARVEAALEVAINDVELGDLILSEVEPVQEEAEPVVVEVVDRDGKPVTSEIDFACSNSTLSGIERLAPHRFRFKRLTDSLKLIWAWSGDGWMSEPVPARELLGQGRPTLKLSVRSASLELEFKAPEELLLENPILVLGSPRLGRCALTPGADGLLRPARPLQAGSYRVWLGARILGEPIVLVSGERRRASVVLEPGKGRLRVEISGAPQAGLRAQLTVRWPAGPARSFGSRTRALQLVAGVEDVDFEDLPEGEVTVELRPDPQPGAARITYRRRLKLGEEPGRVTIRLPKPEDLGAVRCEIPSRCRSVNFRLVLISESLRVSYGLDGAVDQVVLGSVPAGRYRLAISEVGDGAAIEGTPVAVSAGQEALVTKPAVFDE